MQQSIQTYLIKIIARQNQRSHLRIQQKVQQLVELAIIDICIDQLDNLYHIPVETL